MARPCGAKDKTPLVEAWDEWLRRHGQTEIAAAPRMEYPRELMAFGREAFMAGARAAEALITEQAAGVLAAICSVALEGDD